MIAVIYMNRLKDQILIRLAINNGKSHGKWKQEMIHLMCVNVHMYNLQTSLGMLFPLIVTKEA